MPAESAPPQLKHWFDEARYRQLAELMRAAAPSFDSKRFLQTTLDDLAERSLMQRLHQTSLAFDQALPGSFSQKVEVLKGIAPAIEHSFVGIFLSDFIATFGLDSPDLSLDALRHFTCFGSAEFAIRPFIVQDLDRTLTTMHQWTSDPNEHVRRLASEGSRPRLPWGLRLQALVADPQPVAPILNALRDDPALYVRKSVANHLNDITKDHPDWVLDRLAEWNITTTPQRSWIAKQACRTLIKRGHPQALALFGFGKKPAITATFTLSPNSIQLGQSLTLSAELTSTSAASSPQNLAIDYIVHYVRSGDSNTKKVFKWTELQLDSKASVQLTKKQTFRDFSTRRHYPGLHRIELQVNGHRIAETQFTLV
jgi:3-methyladenine DNA glycosylase AlkC